MKKNCKVGIALLAVTIGMTFLETNVTFAAGNKLNNDISQHMNENLEEGSDFKDMKANSDGAFHVMDNGGLDIYKPDKDPNFPNVVVPETVDGIKVTSISSNTFKNKGIESIILPDGITTVGMQAFMGNPLKSVKLPSTLNAISDEMFAGIKTLTSIEIPASVTSIGTLAFRDCGLTSIHIPDQVTTVRPSAFLRNDLSKVELSANMTLLSSGVFSGNKNLKQITIPNSITKIENNAFSNCGLESVQLPKYLTELGMNAFMNNMIKSITIPGTVTDWGRYAFANNALKTVVIEEGVTKVGSDFMNSSAFGENMFNNVSSVTLPSTVTSIDYYTFAESELLYFDLPASVTSLGQDCFLDQKVTMNYRMEQDKAVVNLPSEMTMAKFSVMTPGVTINASKHTLYIPKDIKEITYQYELGTFNGVARNLTGTMTLGKGIVSARFLDFDGSLLETVEIFIGDSAVPSNTPTRPGYTFIGWDKSLDNIVESQDFKAQYKLLPKLTVHDLKLKVGDEFHPLDNVTAIDADDHNISSVKIIENTVDTAHAGTYTVTLEAVDQWGGSTKKSYQVVVEEDYDNRVLKDDKSGILIEGLFSPDAKIIVELTQVSVGSVQEIIKDKDLINAFEVHVIGEYQGKLNITFPVDSQYNGKMIYVYHQKANGTVETFERKGVNGYIDVTVTELSPFVLTKSGVINSVDTSDHTNSIGFLILLTLSGGVLLLISSNMIRKNCINH